MPTEPPAAEPPPELGCGAFCLRSTLFLVVFGVLGLAGIEVWVDRFAWPVADSWYRVEDLGDDVRFGCQNFASVRFSKVPPSGVRRILVLGGSTTFGYPERPEGTHDLDQARHGFVGALQSTLDARWPNAYELINLGINGGNSADTRLVARLAVDWGASGVVLYDGHNEFMSVPQQFRPSTWRVALVRRFSVLKKRADTSPGWNGPTSYGGPPHAEAVLSQLRSNLDDVVAGFQDAGVPVVITTQAANLAGFDPNWSTVGASAELASQSLPELEQAWEEHPTSADIAFVLGHRRLSAHRSDGGLLRRAVDLDALPFRATSAVNDTLRALAEDRGLVVVDAEAAVQADGPPPGDALYYDWVHPRPVAQRRLAAAVLAGMSEAGMLAASEAGTELVLPELVLPELRSEEVHAAELRSARSWLQWAAVRHHDPHRRLVRARHHARAFLSLEPESAEAQGVLAVADALDHPAPSNPVALPQDELVRARLGSLHPGIAALWGLPQ